jgi:hypothetical protein
VKRSLPLPPHPDRRHREEGRAGRKGPHPSFELARRPAEHADTEHDEEDDDDRDEGTGREPAFGGGDAVRLDDLSIWFRRVAVRQSSIILALRRRTRIEFRWTATLRSVETLRGLGVVVLCASAACGDTCASRSERAPLGARQGLDGARVEDAGIEDAAASVDGGAADVRADVSSAESVEAWLSSLPPPSPATRTTVVRFEVVRRRRREGVTAPLLVTIPELGTEREIFDDYVVAPACTSFEAKEQNAVSVSCSAMDGTVSVRAHQDGSELVVVVTGAGDVIPTLVGTHRFALPADRRVEFHLSLPKKRKPNFEP